MTKQVLELSFLGKWEELLPILRRGPDLVNAASESKGYTVLHQAAWHGASLAVVGELLALGADRGLRTCSKQQTAQEIAIEKHADRADLKYIMTPRNRTPSQLIRKVLTEAPHLFGPYDGNRVVCDRLIENLDSNAYGAVNESLEERIDAAFKTATGIALSSLGTVEFEPAKHFRFVADTRFWVDQFLPRLYEFAARAHLIPLEREWTVVSDLFDPPPEGWGLRGDLFLWMEMRQALCHVPLPEQPDDLVLVISSAFTTLTGMPLVGREDFRVRRFARGGMSSGVVCRGFWAETIIRLLQQRAKWLHETWR